MVTENGDPNSSRVDPRKVKFKYEKDHAHYISLSLPLFTLIYRKREAKWRDRRIQEKTKNKTKHVNSINPTKLQNPN